VSGHDLSGLPEMTLSLPKGNRGLRSRAIKPAKNFLPCAAGSCAAKRSTLKGRYFTGISDIRGSRPGFRRK
jgi:hypothetical protein